MTVPCWPDRWNCGSTLRMSVGRVTVPPIRDGGELAGGSGWSLFFLQSLMRAPSDIAAGRAGSAGAAGAGVASGAGVSAGVWADAETAERAAATTSAIAIRKRRARL